MTGRRLRFMHFAFSFHQTQEVWRRQRLARFYVTTPAETGRRWNWRLTVVDRGFVYLHSFHGIVGEQHRSPVRSSFHTQNCVSTLDSSRFCFENQAARKTSRID